MNLHEAVRFARERAGVSAASLSREIGKSPSYIAKLEKQQLEPSFSVVAQIFEVLAFTDQEIVFTVRTTGAPDEV